VGQGCGIMPIKPVDFQVMIPRTMEASKITSEAAQKNLAAMQQQAADTQMKAYDSLRQVYSKDQPHDVHITEKQDKRNNAGEKKKDGRRKNAAQEENQGNYTSTEGSTIDIRI